jgi:hypothetical protein
MTQPGDQLLAVISARRHVSSRAFRDAFNVVHSRALAVHSGLQEPVELIRLRTLRLLSELGHAEMLPYEFRHVVAATPTVLARLPQPGLPRAVLAGSRGIKALELLREACTPFKAGARVLTQMQPYCGGYPPTTVAVEATDEITLQEVAERAGIRFAKHPPAWRLLTTAASVSDYDDSLTWTRIPDPGWPRKDFDISTLTFRSECDQPPIRLSMFSNVVTHRQIHRLWRDGKVADVDRDWGRWLYLRDCGRQVATFDSDAQTVAVPATVPLPRLLARALALFIGMAPFRQSDPRNPSLKVDTYSGLPEEAAGLLAGKLERH